MLTLLSIHNIVPVETHGLEFMWSLGVLTGEPGAGKSILLDAFGLVFGDHAETESVRGREAKASASASVELSRITL